MSMRIRRASSRLRTTMSSPTRRTSSSSTRVNIAPADRDRAISRSARAMSSSTSIGTPDPVLELGAERGLHAGTRRGRGSGGPAARRTAACRRRASCGSRRLAWRSRTWWWWWGHLPGKWCRTWDSSELRPAQRAGRFRAERQVARRMGARSGRRCSSGIGARAERDGGRRTTARAGAAGPVHAARSGWRRRRSRRGAAAAAAIRTWCGPSSTEVTRLTRTLWTPCVERERGEPSAPAADADRPETPRPGAVELATTDGLDRVARRRPGDHADERDRGHDGGGRPGHEPGRIRAGTGPLHGHRAAPGPLDEEAGSHRCAGCASPPARRARRNRAMVRVEVLDRQVGAGDERPADASSRRATRCCVGTEAAGQHDRRGRCRRTARARPAWSSRAATSRSSAGPVHPVLALADRGSALPARRPGGRQRHRQLRRRSARRDRVTRPAQQRRRRTAHERITEVTRARYRRTVSGGCPIRCACGCRSWRPPGRSACGGVRARRSRPARRRPRARAPSRRGGARLGRPGGPTPAR